MPGVPRPTPDPVGPGQESVWDYPRPPRLERSARYVRVELGGVVVAESRRAWRILETSHPPTWYLPPEDCALALFEPAPGVSHCEWKGPARYWTVRAGGLVAEAAVWSYDHPTPPYEALGDHRAFYATRFDCSVDGERVAAQPGGFYGGWITSDVVGPFKGVPGSQWW